jgi:hypothetical protein
MCCLLYTIHLVSNHSLATLSRSVASPLCRERCVETRITGRVSIPYYVNRKGKKNHHCTIRVMVRTSSHVLIFFSLRVGGSTQGGGYMALELFFVSARTNKRHHHLSTCVRNFNMHVKKKYTSPCTKMHLNIHKHDVEHLADSFQGLPDVHATVKYLTPTPKDCMSTCIQNFNMACQKKYMSSYKKMHVNIHQNVCQHSFEISTCMKKKVHVKIQKNACQHTSECMSDGTCIRNLTNFNMHVKKKYMSTYK